MTDHPTSHQPSPDRPPDPPADQRIDALARAAGSALRRPAPADGLDGIRRAGRRRRALQTTAAGAALAAVAVVGVVALSGGDRRSTVVPATAETTPATGPVPASTTPGPLSTDPGPTTAPPGTTDGAGTVPGTEPPTTGVPSVQAPSVVYGAESAIAIGDTIETEYDPATGEAVATGTMDEQASLDAQQQWYGAGALDSPGRILDGAETDRPGVLGYELDLGEVVLRYDVLPSEVPTLADQDPAALASFDRCQQSDLRITGAGADALPARVLAVGSTADRRYLTVLRADCPVVGTLAEGAASGGYDVIVEVYDVADLDLPPRQLVREAVDTCACTLAGFSPDGRFVAVRSLAGDLRFRVFDLASGAERPLTDQCDQQFTAFSDQYGPWVGASTLAVIVDCGDGPALLVIDVDDPALGVAYPSPADHVTWAEVDVAHLADPSTAWYVLCGTDDLAVPATCWVGHGDGSGDGDLIELDGASAASFLPLGFRAGG
jgi:hypothetical protein